MGSHSGFLKAPSIPHRPTRAGMLHSSGMQHVWEKWSEAGGKHDGGFKHFCLVQRRMPSHHPEARGSRAVLLPLTPAPSSAPSEDKVQTHKGRKRDERWLMGQSSPEGLVRTLPPQPGNPEFGFSLERGLPSFLHARDYVPGLLQGRTALPFLGTGTLRPAVRVPQAPTKGCCVRLAASVSKTKTGSI